jgi:hypothetical protein
VQQLKHHLRDRAPKTVNNVLTVLNVVLKKAAEWDVIERMPCMILQDLAGHMDLATTQRHMHLSPAAIEGAIRSLDQLRPGPGFRDILETEDREKGNPLP